MRVGIYQDLRNPPRWRKPWDEVYATGLARIERAEALGLDMVWFSEHHLFEDGYLPQPLVYAAAAAARTSRIRFGTAVALAPLRPAIDYAEQAAIVDLISGGRFELGLGAGYRIPEFEHFGADVTQRYGALEACLAEIRRLLDEGVVTPPPKQDPFPLWAGVGGPRGARIAGRAGTGLLTFKPDVVAPYLEGLEEAGHGAGAARLGGLAMMVVTKDPEAAWHRVKDNFGYQMDSYTRYGAEGREQPGSRRLADMTTVDPDALRSKGPDMSLPNVDCVTPEECVRRLTEWLDGLPVSDVYFWDSLGGMADEVVDEHIELLATEVRPAVAQLGMI